MKNIKNKIEQEGYFCYYTSVDRNEFIVAKDLGGTSYIGGKNVDAFCTLIKENGEYVVSYGSANIVYEEVLLSDQEVIRFIKKQFPI